MAFPTVADGDTAAGTQATNSASWTITYPTNIAVGDLLLLIVATDGAPTPSATGWTVLLNSPAPISSSSLQVLGKIAAGTETGTFTLTLSASESGAFRCLRLPAAGWYGGTLSAGTTDNASDGLSADATASGISTAPDPAGRTPAWGTADTLWFAVEVASSGAVTATGYPTDYTDGVTAGAGGGTGAAYGLARHARSAATEDPGVFSISSAGWVAATLAIRPAGGPSPISGSGGVTFAKPSLSISGKEKITGSGTTTFQKPVLTGTGGGVFSITGTGAITFAKPSLAASAKETITSVGSITFAKPKLSGSESGTTPIAITTFPSAALTLENVLRTHHTPVARLQFLASDRETVLYEATGQLLSGSVTMEKSRDSHRSANVTVVDTDGTLTPESSDSLVWPNRIVRIGRGAMVGTTAQYVDLITGVVDEASFGDNSGSVSFTVWSLLHLANRQFSGPLSFAAGELVEGVVRSIAELAGLGTNDDFYSLSSGGQTLALPRTFDTADTMLGAMVKLANAAGCELYDSGSGVLTLRPFVDPATVTPVWEFTPGVDAVLLSRSDRLKALPGVFNRSIAIGRDPSRYPIRGEWRVTNPADPLFWSEDFDYPRTYHNDDMNTQQMVNAAAEKLGIEGALAEHSSGAATSPIPLLLENGRPVVSYGSEVHLLDRVVCPIGPGSMSMDSVHIRSLVL